MLEELDDLKKGYCYDVGKGVRRNRKYAEKYYLKAAKSGNVIAQYNLAQLYSENRKKAVLKKAVFWWAQAAKQGMRKARTNLGLAYQLGKGVSKNLRKTEKFYLMAARQGDSKAQFNLGLMYSRSKDSAKRKKTSFWYHRAAKQGHAEAQCNLGVMYAEGEGVRRNLRKAQALFTNAAKSGDSVAQRNLELR